MTKSPFEIFVRPRKGLFRRWRYVDSFQTLADAVSAAKQKPNCEYQVRQVWAAGSTL